jgi:hypothetical protein
MTESKLETLVLCVQHLNPPRHRYHFLHRDPRHGDCTVCKPDPENNPYCSGYRPVKVGYVSISLPDDKQKS